MSNLKTSLLNKRIFPDALTAYLMEAMRRCEIRPEDARLTADVLVTTDTWGVYTHGSKQLRPLLRLAPARGDPGGGPGGGAEGPAHAATPSRDRASPRSAGSMGAASGARISITIKARRSKFEE